MSSRRNLSAWMVVFKHAFSGLGYVMRSQQNARIHALATILVIAAGLWLRIERWEWVVLLLTVAMVWLAECFNTALEQVVDLASPDLHPIARRAKDAAAAAVLIAAIISLIIGLLIFIPPLAAKFAA